MPETSEVVDDVKTEETGAAITDAEVDALYDSVMGGKDVQEPSKTEPEKPAGDKFVLEHESFQGGKKEFTREEFERYARQGFESELNGDAFKEKTAALAKDRETIDKLGEYYAELSEMETYMEENPEFAALLKSQWAQIRAERDAKPVDPIVAKLRGDVDALKKVIESKDTEARTAKEQAAKDELENNVKNYMDTHKDFDWKSKNESGLSLREQIEKYAVDGRYPTFKSAANDFLWDQHIKRAEMRGREKTGQALQDQVKRGLGVTTPTAIKTPPNTPRSLRSTSWHEIVAEAIKEHG